MFKHETEESHVEPLYTIYDRVAMEAGPCYCAPNDGVAIRQYRNLLANTPEYQRADYRLYTVGTWDFKKMALDAFPSIREVEVPAIVQEAK